MTDLRDPPVAPVPDWTSGQAAIAYQACAACRHVWYFHRGFCPRCGDSSVQSRIASGRGIVRAVSVVHRAPSEALSKHAPYRLLLVDADEGFRMMGHGREGVGLGDVVRAEFVEFGGALVPRFLSDDIHE